MPRENPFTHHVRALRRLVAAAGVDLSPEVIDSVVVSRVRHVLQQIAEADAEETAADFVDDDTLEEISP
jgi:hypothetical protein